MPIYQIVVLGIVQGLTEFLPISSSAHLYLTSWLMGWNTEALDFDIMLHVGTLIAVVLFFFRDWVLIIAHGFGMRMGHDEALNQNPSLLWLLAIGSIPVGIAGLLFEKQADTTLRTPFVMGTMLILVGIVMWMAENSGRLVRDLGMVSLTDAVSIGLAQALAVIPGTSRSGSRLPPGCFETWTAKRRRGFRSFSRRRRSPRRRARRSITSTNSMACTILQHAVCSGGDGQRGHRMPGHRLVPALLASQHAAAVHLLPHRFWHNSACSGFHPPASVMKLLSPTPQKRLNEVAGFLLLAAGLVCC